MNQIKVAFSSSFKKTLKQYLRKHPQKQQLITNTIELFISDPYHASLETHKLKGKLNGYLSFSVEYDLRIIFFFSSPSEVVFINIGTHDEVY
jgi:addiction module RelE/StbE family toxin